MARNMENIDFSRFLTHAFFLLLHNNGLYWNKTVLFEFFFIIRPNILFDFVTVYDYILNSPISKTSISLSGSHQFT